MTSPAEILPRKEYNTPVSIVRVVPVAPISVIEFQHRVQTAKRERISFDEIPFSEVILLQKSEASAPSAGLVMPIGGEMAPSETTLKAGIRELAEESTLIPLSTMWAEPRINQSYFTYNIPGYSKPRNIYMFTLPVRSSSFSPHVSREGRNGTEDKIERLIAIPSNQLENVLRTGNLRVDDAILQVAGNFTYALTNDIVLSDKERTIQHKMLDDVLLHTSAFEKEFKDVILYQVNDDRRRKNRRLVSRLSECTDNELTKGFISVQMDIDFYGNRTTGKETLLKTANYISGSPPRLAPELLERRLPEDIERHLLYFAPSFLAGARVILEATSVQLTQAESRNPQRLLKLLRKTWLKITDLPASKSVRILELANQAMIIKLSQDLAISPEKIITALNEAVTYHSFFTDSLRGHPDFSSGIFQEYQSRSELTNNPLLFTIASLALGFDPDRKMLSRSKNPEPENRRLPFEAIKILSLFGIDLDMQEKLNNANDRVLQGVINRMFQEEPSSQTIDLGDGKLHHVLYRVTKRKINDKPIFIEYDKRPRKTMHSVLRKSFQDPDIDDINTVNLILAESNFQPNQTIQDRLVLAKQFRDMLIDQITTDLKEDDEVTWHVSIKPGTHKRDSLDTVDRITTEEETEEIVAKGQGKRPGSEGDRILREKFVLIIDGVTKEKKQMQEVLEISIYPFESAKFPGVATLGEKGFWGFYEKLADDYRGTYQALRLIMRSQHYPEEESLFEQFYPAHIYQAVAEKLTHRHVSSRKTQDTA